MRQREEDLLKVVEYVEEKKLISFWNRKKTRKPRNVKTPPVHREAEKNTVVVI